MKSSLVSVEHLTDSKFSKAERHIYTPCRRLVLNIHIENGHIMLIFLQFRCYHAKLYCIRCFYKSHFKEFNMAAAACSITLAARSVKCLRVAAKTRTKGSHNGARLFYLFRGHARVNMSALGIRKIRRYIRETNPYTPIMADSWLGLLRPIPREKRVGSVFFSKPVPTIHG